MNNVPKPPTPQNARNNALSRVCKILKSGFNEQINSTDALDRIMLQIHVARNQG